MCIQTEFSLFLFFFVLNTVYFLRDIFPRKFYQYSVNQWALLIGKFKHQYQERLWFCCILNFLFHPGSESFWI